jgi:hypothetical protein
VAAADTQQNRLDVEAARTPAAFHGLVHRLQGVLIEQGQNADVVAHAATRSVLAFQRHAQLLEHRRQVPAAKDLGVVQGRRPAPQRLQVMTRIEHLLVPPVRARVRGQDLVAEHHVDALDIGLERHRLESGGARHAVAIGVEPHHLVFIHLGWVE